VKARDILLSINGQPVSTPSHVFNLVEDLGPGTPVSLSIIREDEYVTLKTNLAERPDQF
jgi:S1-C subfamily serine protease